MIPSPQSVITSRQNPLVKEIQAIRDDRDSPFIFLEGRRLILEALQSDYRVETLLVSQGFEDANFLKPYADRIKKTYDVSRQVFDALTDVKTPQGMIATVRRSAYEWSDFKKQSPAPLLILDGLQDPGNAASILRTAEAAGAAGIITTPGTARLFSPKALRGAMGSTLRLPILESCPPTEVISKLQEAGYQLLITVLLKDAPDAALYTEVDWKNPWAVVFGQEGEGISSAWKGIAAKQIYIPMREPVESLNVAAAAAVILYEASGQRSNLA